MVVRRVQIESETRHLAEIRAFVERTTADAGVDAVERRRLALAVDEAVSNVMEHGYGGRRDGLIEVEVAVERPRVEVRIRDQGRRFDPTGAMPPPPRFDASGPLRTRGFGLILIHRLMDEVRYDVRCQRVNELVLVRLLEGGKVIPGGARDP
jgi:serine/threonine-protein kinase RsbW